MDETLEKIKSSIERWWTAVNADKRPKPNPARMVTVEELPMYPDETPYYKEVEELPMPESYLSAEEKSKEIFNSAREFKQFLQEDYGVLPKAVAITVGGLTGFFLTLHAELSAFSMV
ncbi:MICOS complex subunit [Dirofilaria immitis]|nr:MICOS complex subunit [Dirofilaria immitis]